jgi:cytochrome c peroxidase
MRKVALVLVILAGLIVVSVAPRHPATGAEVPILRNGPLPPVHAPPDNPQTDTKIRLGHQLYFDKRLSLDSTVSCASCHDPQHGWADTGEVSQGVGGAKGGRNSPSVLNAAHSEFQFWDGRAFTLEQQALGPIQNPVEMKMTMDLAVNRLKSIPGYVKEFQEVFGTEPNDQGVAKAIAAFERTVVSTDSPYDRYIQGDFSAMDNSAVRGMRLFNGKGHCVSCHSGPYFSDGHFHNVGVGYRNGRDSDVGRYKVTNNPKDMGAFKTPGLRGVALTPPYMHDGSEKSLEAAVQFYNRGGVNNPNLDRLMMPLNLTRRDEADLVAFLRALTVKSPDISEPKLPE